MKNVSLELSGFEKLSANELAKVSGGNKIATATVYTDGRPISEADGMDDWPFESECED